MQTYNYYNLAGTKQGTQPLQRKRRLYPVFTLSRVTVPAPHKAYKPYAKCNKFWRYVGVRCALYIMYRSMGYRHLYTPQTSKQGVPAAQQYKNKKLF